MSALLLSGATGVEGRFLFKSYGSEQGLVDPSFESLTQDEDGFLWIGTQSGLVRYDGSRFRRWTSADGLPSSCVYRLRAIPGGGIWLATQEGVVRFQDGAVHRIRSGGRELLGGSANIDLDAEGRLCFLHREGLYRQVGPDELVCLPGAPRGRALGLACSRATGSIFVNVDNTLWERHRDGRWTLLGPETGLRPEGRLWAMAEDGTGRWWVGGDRKLFYRDAGEASFHDASSWLPAPPFTEGIFLPSRDGCVYIPTNQGLLRVRGGEREVIDRSRGLPGKWTRAGMVDREGNLWVLGPALYRMLGRGFVRAHTTEEGLPSEMVCLTYQDRLGRLWAGTNDGLAIRGPRGWSRVPGTENLTISGLAMDSRGWLWIAAWLSPIHCLKPGDTRASELPFRALRWVGEGGTQEAPDSAASLLLDHQGHLWLGNVGRGIYRVDLTAAEIHPAFGPAEVQSKPLVPLALREDGRGRIWAATNRGLACREEDGRWRLFGKAQGLKHDGVHGLTPAGDGSLWIYYYYESFGLDRVAYEDGRFEVKQHLDTADRLVSDTVFSALQDRAGALWVGTNRGLDRFEGGNYLHLGQGQGLVGEDCWANAICQATDGDLWQGTSNGLVQILAGRRPPPVPIPRVFIQQVVQGKSTLFPPFARRPAVSHRDATLEFWFSAPTYVDEISVRYQVRMIGLEEEWRTTDVHQARFVALPGGRYRFEVRAAYPGGPYGPVAAFEVQVRPPWWRSWWFVFLELVSVAGLMGVIVKWRLRALARQKNRLQALVEEQTRDLQKANLALAEANRALEALSLTDSLTGLHNRRYLAMVIDDNVTQTMRAYRDGGPGILANRDLTFFMVDIDHFKQINDRFGHGVGDQVLLRIAGTLRSAARESDAVIRWGGEEFLLVARNSSRAEAPSMAERIRSLVACQCLKLPNGQTVRWTCSVGFAAFPFLPQALDWLGWEEVVDLADTCLYGAKESGRDAWVGVQAGDGCDPARHGPRLPHDLRGLAREGVVRILSSRGESFGREEEDGTLVPRKKDPAAL